MKFQIVLMLIVFILNTLFLTHIYGTQSPVSLAEKINALQEKREARERKAVTIRAYKEQKERREAERRQRRMYSWDDE